ncbi:MAG TPA: D-alanyl-D-alanine carboxypeptidase family protein [Chthoniobacter sp.]|nr:D-alanyl-D-alanine carboxypeptidase family protein [Chthoniobacter sp.]
MKRFASLFVLTFLLFALVPTAPAATKKKKPASSDDSTQTTPKRDVPEAFPATDGAPAITAGSAILIDAKTGKVIFELNADKQRPVASTQKLLTSLIVAESGDLDRKVRVEASDTWAEPTMLYIKPGEVYSRYDFVNVLLVHSMNDVARALARDNAGSIEGFAARMNAKAAQLGMRNSNFVNPNGLPVSGQYSTARDMAQVALAAYKNPIIRGFVCQKSVTWHYNDGRVRVFETTNQVLKRYPLCNGMKTGYTEAAGHCLISSASHGGREVIAVVLGDSRNIWNDSYKLLAFGLSS